MFRGRRHITAQDLRDLAPDVLRHRLVLSYDALSDGITADALIEQILAGVALPSEDHMSRASEQAA
jgi:MoxR-like ATPase